MHLPWDRDYFKICLYVIFTFTIIYIFKQAIDGVVYVFANAGGIYASLKGAVKGIASVFSVLIGGFAVAYVLEPLVAFLNKRIKSRRLCVGVVYLILFLVVVILILSFLKKISFTGGYEISRGISDNYEKISEVYSNFRRSIKFYRLDFVLKYSDGIISSLGSVADRFVNGCMAFFSSLGRLAVTTFLSLVCAYYFLVEKEGIIQKIKCVGRVFVSEKFYESITFLLEDMHKVFSGYIRGQALDAVVMATLISVGLSVLGIKYAVLIGLISGFSNIIPYFGAIIGFLLGVFAALIGGEPIKAIYVACIIVILQQVDSVIISPRIVGNKVSLSPVAVILSLTVAGRLFGIAGMVFAVPAVAFLKLIIKRKLY